VGNELESLDFFTDPSLVADPYPYYDAIRECPVRREPHHDVVLVSGYDEVVAVCREDRDNFSACNVVSGPFPGLPVAAEGDDISDLIEQYRDTLPLHEYFASFDPPTHTNHRALLARLLTPKRLKENEDFMWSFADGLIDAFLDSGSCEFVGQYAEPAEWVNAFEDVQDTRGNAGPADPVEPVTADDEVAVQAMRAVARSPGDPRRAGVESMRLHVRRFIENFEVAPVD